MDVVFDLGGVILTWNPRAIIAGVFADPAVQQMVLREVFRHRDWVELDRGTLTREAAIANAVSRTGLSSADLRRLFAQVAPALVPIPQMIGLLSRLKARGHRLYCLSNMHRASLAYLRRRYDFWGFFDASVFSCLVHLCKPEPAIYEHMLSSFGLRGPETLFLDDMEVNLEAARAFGIRTLRVESRQQCLREMEAMGLL